MTQIVRLSVIFCVKDRRPGIYSQHSSQGEMYFIERIINKLDNLIPKHQNRISLPRNPFRIHLASLHLPSPIPIASASRFHISDVHTSTPTLFLQSATLTLQFPARLARNLS